MRLKRGRSASNSDKKANVVVEGIMIMLVILVFVICTFVGKLIFNEINDEMQADPDMNNETKELLQEENDKYSGFFDGLILFVFILIWIGTIIASFMVDAHPIFFIFTLIIMIFIFFIAAMLGNVYEEFTQDPDMAVIATEFPITNWLLSHYLIVMIVVAFSIALALFGKNQLR